MPKLNAGQSIKNVPTLMRMKTWTTRSWFIYSHADRIRAVELYIKLGKRVKATLPQLGYPIKNALSHWYCEYEQHRDLYVRCVARTGSFLRLRSGRRSTLW